MSKTILGGPVSYATGGGRGPMKPKRPPTPCSLCRNCARWTERMWTAHCTAKGAAASRLTDTCTDYTPRRDGSLTEIAAIMYGNGDTRFNHV